MRRSFTTTSTEKKLSKKEKKTLQNTRQAIVGNGENGDGRRKLKYMFITVLVPQTYLQYQTVVYIIFYQY